MSGFEVFDDGSFKKKFDTEKEAVARYQNIIDANGYDSTGINVYWGNNPVAFESFKSTAKGFVNIGIIIRFEGKYDVLFTTIPNEDTTFFDVLDNDGVVVSLIHEKK